MQNGDNFVKVVTVIEGEYRNQNITHNFHDLNETAQFMDQLAGTNVKNVKWFRVCPQQVDFSNPREAARGLDGISSTNRY